jgi:hypothetical protein
MDGLSDSFGRLSTNAQEWRPSQSSLSSGQLGQSSSAASALQYQSDLNPTAVKEFVPGTAWSSQGGPATGRPGENIHSMTEKSSTSSSHLNSASPVGHIDPTSGQPGEASVPAGPSPPPPPAFRSLHSMGLSDNLWRHYRQMALESHRQVCTDY